MSTPGDTPASRPLVQTLAESTVCVVRARADGSLEIDLGHSLLRLDKQRFASLAGTLRRVTREHLFARPASTPARPHLRLVWPAPAAVEETP